MLKGHFVPTRSRRVRLVRSISVFQLLFPGRLFDLLSLSHNLVIRKRYSMSASASPRDFKPNRSLLNPKFEGYKFYPLPQDDLTHRYVLQYKPTQTNASASHSTQPMTFQEVQSRITHNHLTVKSGSAVGVYVDADYRVIGVTADPVSECVPCPLLPSYPVLI